MRLINCRTKRFEEFFGKQIPDYAILSHTWGASEISFKDFNDALSGFSLVFSDMSFLADESMHKIINTCAQARKDHYDYVWIDSCCIDKSSSAELSEAINSMYKWYQNARRCYVYLNDLDLRKQPFKLSGPGITTLDQVYVELLRDCRWFRRGWTLQELLAPGDVAFYDRHWYYIGSRFERATPLAVITRIPRSVLNRTTASYTYCAAQKMSWAAMRETTREEDIAYCLFGLFGVNLPLLYGEGAERAFIRLQEEIMKESNDLTLFAWQAESVGCYRGILARSPREFKNAVNMTSIKHVSQNPEFTVTNKGLRIQTPLVHGPGTTMFMPLNCTIPSAIKFPEYGIYLVKYWGQIYRESPHALAPRRGNMTETEELIYVTKNIEIPMVPWEHHASVLGPDRSHVTSDASRQRPLEMPPPRKIEGWRDDKDPKKEEQIRMTDERWVGELKDRSSLSYPDNYPWWTGP